MSGLRLPSCSIRNPTCGACLGETSHDGDSFYCQECGLDYGDGDDSPAIYRDEDAETCAAPCANSWHAADAIRTGWSYECHPCALPTGHNSDHWTPCKPTKSTHPGATA